MTYTDKSDGFTLVEVIISIAILSVASVVALQLFITSQDMNTDSRHADIASVQATNFIENIRAYDSTHAMLTNTHGMEATASGFHSELYYDRSFDAVASPSEGVYLLSCDLTLGQQGLYDLHTSVKVIETDKELVFYTTKHYFKEEVNSNDL